MQLQEVIELACRGRIGPLERIPSALIERVRRVRVVADFTKFEQNRILIGTFVIRHRALIDKRVTLGYPDAGSFVSFRSLQILHAGCV